MLLTTLAVIDLERAENWGLFQVSKAIGMPLLLFFEQIFSRLYTQFCTVYLFLK